MKIQAICILFPYNMFVEQRLVFSRPWSLFLNLKSSDFHRTNADINASAFTPMAIDDLKRTVQRFVGTNVDLHRKNVAISNLRKRLVFNSEVRRYKL